MKELIFEYTSIISSIMLLVYYTNELISLFEFDKYNFKDSFIVIKIYFSKWFNYFPLILIPFIFFIDNWYVGLIYSVINLIFLIFLRLKHHNLIKDYWKSFRLYILLLILETIFGTILMLNVNFVELTSLLIIVLNVHFIIVFLCFWLLYPVEKLLNYLSDKLEN